MTIPFILELGKRAWDSSVASMGTTSLAIGVSLIYPCVGVVRVLRSSGLDGLKAHWKAGLKVSVIIAFCAWGIPFSYHLFYKVPKMIRTQAKSLKAPVFRKPILPDFWDKKTELYASKLEHNHPVPQPPIIIETAPVFGNLHDRAIALSDEIMEDLYRHGWKNVRGKSGAQGLPSAMQMPTDAAGIQNWARSRANYFRFRFFERVLDLRNEFAQLHLRDQQLDEFFKYQGMVEEANRQMVAAGNLGAANNVGLLLPQEIEEVTERLKILVKQLPVQRSAPKPLRFSVTRVQPEKPDIPFEIVITIQTDTNVAEGYITVEFDGPKASVSTDFVGSRFVFDQESLIGNKPLLDYLRSHSPGDIYLLEIGSAPLMTKKPIHVIAYGGTEFRVVSVTLFAK